MSKRYKIQRFKSEESYLKYLRHPRAINPWTIEKVFKDKYEVLDWIETQQAERKENGLWVVTPMGESFIVEVEVHLSTQLTTRKVSNS